jgi:DNA gyrase subunit A
MHSRERIEEVPIDREMRGSYLLYAMSVIASRALPDVRDGLKPSQRRLLVTMNDLGLTPRAKYRKCAKITGDTFGNYHPLGEQSLYPTLVRLAQDFVLRYPLVQGQGNFGSQDGDPPAAQRYTEARMTPLTVEMLQDIDKDTVDFAPNYDNTRSEPQVLAAKIPNLLCNGCSGIAVGMATSIPPHNLAELCDALIKLIDEPEMTVDDLIEIVHGPDFPTGGLICGRSGILSAYRTGRGQVVLRARTHVESGPGGKKSIVVTEVPYQLNRDAVLEKIADLVKAGKLSDISDIRNESDREGTRLVIDLRRDADEEVVVNQLFEHTQLQERFNIMMIALVNRRPRTLNLKEMLQCFVDHRFEVITRRAAYLLAQAEARAHILEGLLIALDNIDEVIKIIRGSKTVDTARAALIKKFKLSEQQANAILRMQLQRLTGLERDALKAEYKELQEQIADYKALLADRALVYDVIREDLYEMKEKYGDARRTEIAGEAEGFCMEDLVAEQLVVVPVSRSGYIKRMPLTSYRRQNRGGVGITGAAPKEGDIIEHLFVPSTHDYILFFTDRGRVYWQKVYDIPQMGRTSRGRAIVNLLNLERGEQVTSMIPVRDFGTGSLMMATARGVVKRTALSAFGNPRRGGIIAIRLRKGDSLVSVRMTRDEDDVVLGTRGGMAIRFATRDARLLSRGTMGVKGISLKKGDVIQGMVVVEKGAGLLAVCENGYGKRTNFDAYRRQRRGGKGLINIKTSKRNGNVVSIVDVRESDEIIVVTTGGMVVRIPVSSIREIGRNTQGVRVIALKADHRVAGIARVPVDESAQEEAAE